MGGVNWGVEESSEVKFGTHWPRSNLFTRISMLCIHTAVVTLETFLCEKNAQNRLINLDLCSSIRYAIAEEYALKHFSQEQIHKPNIK